MQYTHKEIEEVADILTSRSKMLTDKEKEVLQLKLGIILVGDTKSCTGVAKIIGTSRQNALKVLNKAYAKMFLK